jgi:dienelactone hydrolase
MIPVNFMSRSISRAALIVGALGTVACAGRVRLAPDDSHAVLASHSLTAANPAETGALEVRTLFYGSGTDKRREEFRDLVTLKTQNVDASPFVSITGDAASTRRKYWGFEPRQFPINGRVWYPAGEGPFPLVLVVHGNHDYRDYSDPGYQYLGELLASRGFITVSVDMNFINGLSGENDGRAWLLLKHLEAWRSFADSAGGPFHNKVDMSRISLIGHSRGGEAVGHAAAFNRLQHYPDDAKVAFDFGFGIRSIVAIAPVDGQYRPADRFGPIENVSYLVFHGSHDGDVTTFGGMRTFQRLQFTDGQPRFKSAIYMYRANHGQWNSVWGNLDRGRRSGRFLQLRALIDAEEQRDFARVAISAFLEATLNDDQRYLPMFRDHRVAGDWLPKTMYITRFEASGFRALARFEEDIDVRTGTATGVTLRGDSLSVWKEAVVPFRTQNANQGTNAVWLGWNNRIAGDDTTRFGEPASYTVTLPASLGAQWGIDRSASLSFALAPTDVKPAPRRAPRDTTQKTDSTPPRRVPAPRRPDPAKAAPDTVPMDLTIEVTDGGGRTARVPLSRYGAVRRPLETRIMRREIRDKAQFTTLHELVLQSYEIPFADILAAVPGFDPSTLRTIRFVFDRTVAGTVIIDDIGISPLGAVIER